MRTKTNKYGLKKYCPNCNYKLRYSWVGGMAVGYIFLYSDKSNEILVSQELFQLYLSGSESGKQFEDKLQKYLDNKNLRAKGFNMSNALKCPNCSFKLNQRSDGEISKKLQDKAVYISGMIFRTDKDAFIVEMTK